MLSTSDPTRRAEILERCTRTFGHPVKPLRERLLDIAASTGESERADRYGGGALLESFEAEIAGLLGKEAAVFMPSGTMAQQIALRLHAEDTGNDRVALHPRSHLVVHESDAVQKLSGLRTVLIGDADRPFTRSDFDAQRESVGSVLIELPDRELGGVLRPWNELCEIIDWAMERKVRIHLDGARLWETQPYYARPLDQIAGPFDSAYVSFYKILNGISGAALAGNKGFIDRARLWQHRFGGRLISLFPEILSARAGLQRYLPRMGAYRQRATEIAAVLCAFDDISVTPDPPHINMMHVFIRGDGAALDAGMIRAAEQTGIKLFGSLNPTGVPGVHQFELSVAEGAFEITDAELRDYVERMLAP